MKYLVEVETVIGGEIVAAGTVIENPETVVAGMVRMAEEAPAPKAKAPKVETVEIKEELLTEVSETLEVEITEEVEEVAEKTPKKMFSRKRK
jgi:hypothetical protein